MLLTVVPAARVARAAAPATKTAKAVAAPDDDDSTDEATPPPDDNADDSANTGSDDSANDSDSNADTDSNSDSNADSDSKSDSNSDSNSDSATDSSSDSSDASGIEEKVGASARELEELHKAEDQALPETASGPKGLHRLGLANPLRLRASDLGGLQGVAPAATEPREGDAGDVLAELGGIDLAALKKEYDIPVDVNDDVLEYIRFFQTSGRQWYAKWLERSHRWIAFERPILAEEGVPLDLVYLSMIESGFSAYAYSWARASGLWQFVSATGKRFGCRDDFWVDERRDPEKATRAAARYLKALHDEFGDWYLAWAAYNAGEGKIRNAIKRYGSRDFWELAHDGSYLRKETKHYVPKLIAAALIAKHPKRFGFDDAKGDGPFEYDTVEVPDATDLAVVAKAAGVSIDQVQQLNPALRRWCTPPARGGHGYDVKLPKGTKAEFLAEFAKVKPAERLTFRHHRVQRGDTLGAIAREFRMPVEPIMRLNHLKSARLLRVGADLIIPLPTQLAKNYPDTPDWQEPSGHSRRHRARHAVARASPRPAHAGPGHYVVHAGDTLWSIAQRFGIEVTELKRWNGLSWRSTHALQVGRSLRVAPPARRKVERDRDDQDG